MSAVALPARRPLLTAAGCAVVLLIAVPPALRLAEDGWQDGVAVAVTIVGAVALVFLAAVRFEFFILAVLGLRASADWSHAAPEAGELATSGELATGLALAFLLASGLWYAAQRLAGTARPPSAASWAVLALMAAALVSAAGAARPSLTIAEAARVVAGGAMLLVLDQLLVGAQRARRVLLACLASAVVPLLVGAVQIAGGEVERLRGTFVHPNAYGFYLVLILLMGIALLPHLRGWWRVALVPVLVLASVSLVLTYSRGSWIALIAGLLIIAALQSPKLLIPMIVAVVAVPSLVPAVGERLSDLDEERTLRGTGGNSLVWRLDYWRESLELAGPTPLTGIGLKMTEYSSASAVPPHNDYIRMYVEAGVLGLGAYLAMLVVLCRSAFRALRRAGPGFARGSAVGFAACLAAFAVASIGSNIITGVVLLWYFFAFAAAAER